ncbi:hypothetical protein Cpa01nite_20530 [Cellulomonas pakistanensis]|uniref:Lipoprotein n=1 Tax=Cellulomonas pakistanensis TaxID=992287 RepID=A0A919U764_9CELL|nr:hypothetical protein Cpa01nite_20530 [Cellulomonas pakistanensis]
MATVARGAALRRRTGATGLGLAVLVAAACTPGGVDVRGQLPPCPEAKKLPVEELAAHTDCSLEGSTLLFPDGRKFEVGSANGSASTSEEPGLEWGATSWGGDGTVAWRRTEEGLSFWGPRAAVEQEILLWSLDRD